MRLYIKWDVTPSGPVTSADVQVLLMRKGWFGKKKVIGRFREAGSGERGRILMILPEGARWR